MSDTAVLDVDPPEQAAEPPVRRRGRVRVLKNPVLRRELIERVKGVKGAVFVSVWLVFLTAILLLAYFGSIQQIESDFGNSGIDIGNLGRVGRQVYEWVLFGMLLLVLFLVPGLTAGTITGERERQTLVPLQMTLMRPRDIVLGKLSSALAFLVLLVVAAMPLLAASLLVGGIGLLDVLRGLGTLLFTGLVLGAVCVMISSVFRRTTSATVVSYAVSMIFAVGSFVLILAWLIIDEAFLDRSGNDFPTELLGFNPFAGLADALPRAGRSDTSTPFGGLRSQIDDNSGNFGGRGTRVWLWYYGIGVAVLILSIWRAARSVRTPAETER